MKYCPKCNSEYEDDVRFCKKDGTPLETKVEKAAEGKKCPQCGKLYPEDDGFCSVCGVKLIALSDGNNHCPECGAELSEGAAFCSKCGTAVTGKNDNTTSKELPHDMEDVVMTQEELNKIVENHTKELPHDMVYVEGGSLWLGNRKNNKYEVTTLDSFYISKYQVTQQLWNSVMSYDNSEHKGENRPVDCVSWYDAVEFCNELSKKDGLTPCYKIDKSHKDPNNKCDDDDDDLKWTVECNFMANGYRLPTEAEWEYAARGGLESKGYRYAGSNELDRVAWYKAYSHKKKHSHKKTHNVGEKNCNELGLYDMSGNVWEWCWDWFGDVNGGRNPTGLPSGCSRVLRGGAVGDYGSNCAVDYRSGGYPDFRNSYSGFRLVRTAN